MIESTARAERFEPVASAAHAYLWQVPQKPLAIRVAVDAIDRLERAVLESFRSVKARGSEIGGLLLGRPVPGGRLLVAIEDFEPIPCDYSRGPLYRLATEDKARFESAIRQRAAASGGLKVVGAFRSNTRKDLSLDADDIEFFSALFTDPHSAFLLVKPFATKPCVAGFFICENGQVQGEATPLEFPFNTAELQRRKLIVEVSGDERAAAAEPPPVKPEPSASNGSGAAAPVKPAARAQVVPIASRREVSAPPPPAAPEPDTPEPKDVAPEPAPAEEQAAPPAAAQPPAKIEKPAAEVERPLDKAPSFGVAEEEEARGSGMKKLLYIGGGAVVLVLLILLLAYPGLLLRRGPSVPAGSPDAGMLALRVERNAGQLILTWNRESDAVKTATKAVLSISDGAQQENVQLDLAQLKNGSVVYSPVTSDVNFRLEVTSSNAANSRSEYVRVLGTKPSPLVPESPDAKGKPAVPAAPAAAEPAPEGTADQPAPEPAAPKPQAESLADRLRPAKPAEIAALPAPTLEPPTALAAHPSTSVPLPFSTPNVAPPQRPAPPPAEPQARPAQSATIGGHVVEARLISRREPVYPPLARQARIRGVVQLEATVGADGKVKEVNVISGHPLLKQAAVDAVKRWLYSPSLLNGKPVEVKTRVAVDFSLGN